MNTGPGGSPPINLSNYLKQTRQPVDRDPLTTAANSRVTLPAGLSPLEDARSANRPAPSRNQGPAPGQVPATGKYNFVQLNDGQENPLQLIRLTDAMIEEGRDTSKDAANFRARNPSDPQTVAKMEQLVPQLRSKMQSVYNALIKYSLTTVNDIPPQELYAFQRAYQKMAKNSDLKSTTFDADTAAALDKMWGLFGYKGPRSGDKIVLDRTSLALMDFITGNTALVTQNLNSPSNQMFAGYFNALASIMLPYKGERAITPQTEKLRDFIERIRYAPLNLQPDARAYLAAADEAILRKINVGTTDTALTTANKVFGEKMVNQDEWLARFVEPPPKNEYDDDDVDPNYFGSDGRITPYRLSSRTYIPPDLKIEGYQKIAPIVDKPNFLPPILQNIFSVPSLREHDSLLLWDLRKNFGNKTFAWRYSNGKSFRSIYELFEKFGLERKSPYGLNQARLNGGRDRTPPEDNAWDMLVPKETAILTQGEAIVLSADRHNPRSDNPNKGYGNHVVLFYPHKSGNGGLIVVHNHLANINQSLIDQMKASQDGFVRVPAGTHIANSGNSGEARGENGGYHDHIVVFYINESGEVVQTWS